MGRQQLAKYKPKPNTKSTMIKIIASTLAVFLYGTNAANQRLLQQTGPEFVPAPGAAPATPETTPAKGGAVPFIPFIPSVTAPTLTLECTAPYTMIGQTCAGSLKEFTNPVNEFKIGCSALGGCAQTTFEFNYDARYYGERINGMIFSEAYSGYQTSITLDNQSPYNLYIDNLECKAAGACQDMKIKVIGGGVNDVSCQRNIGACNGCTIELCKREANGAGEIVIACEPPKSCNLW